MTNWKTALLFPYSAKFQEGTSVCFSNEPVSVYVAQTDSTNCSASLDWYVVGRLSLFDRLIDLDIGWSSCIGTVLRTTMARKSKQKFVYSLAFSILRLPYTLFWKSQWIWLFSPNLKHNVIVSPTRQHISSKSAVIGCISLLKLPPSASYPWLVKRSVLTLLRGVWHHLHTKVKTVFTLSRFQSFAFGQLQFMEQWTPRAHSRMVDKFCFVLRLYQWLLGTTASQRVMVIGDSSDNCW